MPTVKTVKIEIGGDAFISNGTILPCPPPVQQGDPPRRAFLEILAIAPMAPVKLPSGWYKFKVKGTSDGNITGSMDPPMRIICEPRNGDPSNCTWRYTANGWQ